MASYTRYQCTVCRRFKDILRNDSYVTPNLCVITKGCSGRLSKITDVTVATATPSVPGLTDWYARGINYTSAAAAPVENIFLLSTSSTGALTLGVVANASWVAANQNIVLRLIQRRTDDISYQQYQFNLTSPSAVISGRDVNGKILKFDLTAYNQNRIFVRVNGVMSAASDFANWAANVITFNKILPIGTLVEISVYSQQQTISRDMKFIANQDTSVSVSSGAWGNINWMNDNATPPNQIFIYSSNDVNSLPKSAKFKVDGLYSYPVVPISTTPTSAANIKITSTAVILLASDPYENADRYLNYSIDISTLTNDFNLISQQNTFIEMYSDFSFVTEIFPPYHLIKNAVTQNSSYLVADSFSTAGVAVDPSAVRLSGTKIIGPI